MKLTRYGVVAFVAGFVLMSFELVAARLLAPSIGTSTYIWTSVIGVMIAALAAGYAVGGWVADHRAHALDIAWLLLISAAAIMSTLVLSPIVLQFVTHWVSDPRLQGIAAAIVLFLPASFVLGSISPYLARLQTKSVDTTGRTVASLSALNSLGGIAGTFSTGFIFFSLIGSRQSLMLLMGILAVTSWLIEPRRHIIARGLATLLLGAIIVMYSSPIADAQAAVEIDTPTSHYEIKDLVYGGEPIRGLLMGPGGIQSAISKTDPKSLVLWYTARIADLVNRTPHHDRILVIGGGAFSLPEYLSRTYPQAKVDVVEIDPQLPGIAQKYFDYQPQPNTTVYQADARPFLDQTTTKYDVVIVDAYSDFWVPFALTTREFTQHLATLMRPGGVVLANVIGSDQKDCVPYVASVNNSYASAFRHQAAFPVASRLLSEFQNIILSYSDEPLTWSDGDLGRTTYPSGPAIRLTDDFAPVEGLLQRCMGINR